MKPCAARLLAVALALAVAPTACTLALNKPAVTPLVVTATLVVPPNTVTPAHTLAPPPTATVEPLPTASPEPAATDTPAPAPTSTPGTPTPSATPAPTRTRPGPTPLPPLDDGSGGVVPGTGGAVAQLSPVAGLEALPATLYYLSANGGSIQVWRLRIGLSYPDQLTFSPDGVAAFDVAPDGTLAYLTPGGSLIVGGIPLLPPQGTGGSQGRVTALAWSPNGIWLAYTLVTADAAGAAGGAHEVDGLWLRSSDGNTVRLQPSVYAPDDSRRIFTGPLRWRPDSSEILAGYEIGAGTAFCRVLLSNSTLLPLWQPASLPPDSFTAATWNDNGTAIIASGAGAVRSIEPDTLQARSLIAPDSGFWPVEARQFAEGTLAFVDAPPGARRAIYLVPRGAGAPLTVVSGLPESGALDALWDDFARQVIIATRASEDALLGTPILYDTAGGLFDLTPLSGPAGVLRWGPAFRTGDEARVRTSEGDPLSLRATPGGEVLLSLVNGSWVRVTGGPRVQEGYRWWRVQTPNGVSGWVVEAVRDGQGELRRTLLPVG
jgi:dipeptidyl aminopeptidase/acylaminoacyl peptidase